jgi:hypothetical protein
MKGEIMNQARFSKDEAERLLGTRVRTCDDLTDVPAGTPGQVNGWQEVGRAGEYAVIVRFDPVLTARPVIKALSKSDFRSIAQEAPTL